MMSGSPPATKKSVRLADLISASGILCHACPVAQVVFTLPRRRLSHLFVHICGDSGMPHADGVVVNAPAQVRQPQAGGLWEACKRK